MESGGICSNAWARHCSQASVLRVKISVLCGQIIDSAQNSSGFTGFSPLACSIGEVALSNLSSKAT
jgi:predicted butyrate kinase (DUF1464 family)